MSVTTKAEESITRAKNLISDAYKELLVVLNEDTWGHDEFIDGYIDEVHEVAKELLKLKRKL